MKKNTITLLFLIFSFGAFAQENKLQHFMNDCKKEVGVWVADNSEYKNENEPYDQYAIEWKWGLGNRSLIGRLYAIKDGKDIGSFWQFRKYFDPSTNKVIVIQFSSDGSFGHGMLTHLGKNEIKLEQTFANPDGTTYKMGHKTNYINQDKQIGESFMINNEDKWISNRSYTWIRLLE